MMSDERLAWVVTHLEGVLEASLQLGIFLPLLIAAAIVKRQRRAR
jgi:hypothetical protein